jgi:hypothetical protein
MAQDTATPVTVSECEVMASIDSGPDGEQLVIAEVCKDDAYLAIGADATVVVDDWR